MFQRKREQQQPFDASDISDVDFNSISIEHDHGHNHERLVGNPTPAYRHDVRHISFDQQRSVHARIGDTDLRLQRC